MKTNYLIIIAAFLFMASCATSSSYNTLETQKDEAPRELSIPAGVDSLTAAESRELADASFVSYQEEQEAEALKRRANAYRAESDTLWHYLSLDVTEEDEAVEEDPYFVDSFNEGAEYFTAARTIEEQHEISQEDLDNYSELVTNAINAFEDALMLNPFDIQTRLVLGQLYGVKASRLNQQDEHKKAIDVLEKLVRLEKGEHIIYSSLAENYYQVNNYELSAENFNLARETLKQSAMLTEEYYEHGGFSPQDSLNIFLYTYYAGESYINLLDTENAMAAFENALDFATTEDDIEVINSQIHFINWDDGNILGSMRRDSLAALVNNDQLEDAESGFKELKNSLKTNRAKDEIDWRLGVVQYQIGNQDEAADRLLNLVQRTDVHEDGSPVDSLYIRYFRDFGTITYNIGIDYRRNNERNLALKYLNQSTKVNWDNRSRSYLQIADLLSNNVDEAIRFAELAEAEIDSLEESEIKSLYELLADLHRRARNTELAQHYFQLWREI